MGDRFGGGSMCLFSAIVFSVKQEKRLSGESEEVLKV